MSEAVSSRFVTYEWEMLNLVPTEKTHRRPTLQYPEVWHPDDTQTKPSKILKSTKSIVRTKNDWTPKLDHCKNIDTWVRATTSMIQGWQQLNNHKLTILRMLQRVINQSAKYPFPVEVKGPGPNVKIQAPKMLQTKLKIAMYLPSFSSVRCRKVIANAKVLVTIPTAPTETA